MQHRASCTFLAITFSASTLCFGQIRAFSNEMAPTDDSQVQTSITGVVASMNGSPLHDIRIEVRSVTTGMVVATCYSDRGGGFMAYHLRNGVYEIAAFDGANETRERVDLESGGTNVNLRLPEHAAPPSAGTVSVAQLKTPEKARNLVEKARSALRKNKVADAEKYLNAALQVAPDNPVALTLRALMRVNANQTEAAIEDLDQAVKADPTYGPAYLLLGSAFNDLGRFDEALRSLDRESIYEPKSWQCALEMAKSWLGKHEYGRALQQLDRAQALGAAAPTMGPIHVLRGYALIGEKHFAEAGTELQAYLATEPNGQLAGSVRATIVRVQTMLSEQMAAVPLTPKTSGIFASAQ
jgi:tetratricopeptide (TPR) repeat protein